MKGRSDGKSLILDALDAHDRAAALDVEGADLVPEDGASVTPPSHGRPRHTRQPHQDAPDDPGRPARPRSGCIRRSLAFRGLRTGEQTA